MSTDAATIHQIRDGWARLAARFDEHTTPLTMAFAEQVLDHADVGPGTRVLDVAAGSGALSVPAARRGAEVMAVDIAPAMIDRLTARARDEGLETLEGRVMDGTALAFADGAFHVAVSLNGVSLFPNVDRGLAETARVLEPGGRVLVAAFGAPSRAEFLAYFLAALQAAVPGFTPPPVDPPPPPFQLADRQTFRRRLVEAGLRRRDVARALAGATRSHPDHRDERGHRLALTRPLAPRPAPRGGCHDRNAEDRVVRDVRRRRGTELRALLRAGDR